MIFACVCLLCCLFFLLSRVNLTTKQVARMREHKSAIEKQMAEKNENSKRDIVCEVRGGKESLVA